MPIIVVERGDDKGKSLTLEAGRTYVFGRDPKATDFVLSDTMASRRHFSLEVVGGAIRIRDMESTNGTFLNDERIDEAEVKVGDKIQVGGTIFSCLSDQREETAQGLIGKSIGGYQILERIGRGGMGTVYKATQLSLNRTVAFKVLSSRLLKDDKFIVKFKSEAQAAGNLNHPNIVQVYDVGTDRNLHFFSMEFMDGGSIQDKIGKDGKLTFEEALDVFIQATRALIFAEKNGIVHRDVKPDNLMYTGDGQVKLLDLGLARRVGEETAVEGEGIFGTPHFISPEQAQGKPVDQRADLYSLGATIYRLLAGRTPFDGANVREIVQKQINAEPVPLRKLAPDIPEELAAVIGKLMKKNPDERYASAAALLEDLEKIRLRYHLKVHGVGGGGKGVFVALALAVAAVAGVAVFALTRDDNDRPLPPGPVGTAGLVPATGTQQPEVIIQKDRESLAMAAFFQIKADDAALGDPAKTWQTRSAEWKALLGRYRGVAKEYSDTEHGGQAGRRADDIEGILRAAEETARSELGAAQAAWQSLNNNVTNALTDEKYVAALEILKKAAADPQVRAARSLLPESGKAIDAWLGNGPGSVTARFAESFGKARASVEEFRKAGDFAGAVATLRSFLARAGATPESPFAAAVSEAGELAGQLADELKGLLEDRLQGDSARYFSASREIRHYAEEEAAFPGGNPVFDYRFEEAADRLGALLADGGLTTSVYRQKAEARIRGLRAAAALLDAFVTRINEKRLATEALDFPADVAGGPGVTVEINHDKQPVATRVGLEVTKKLKVAGGVAVSAEVVHWSRFSPTQLWQAALLAGKRWEMSPTEHAAAACFLAETGVLVGLREEIAAAGEALDEPARARLHAEASAMEAYRALLDARGDQPPEQWQVLAAQFVGEHAATDFFILVYGFPEAGERSLLPAAVRDAWIEGEMKSVQWP